MANTALAQLSAATLALAEAKSLDEIKRIRDVALAAHTYAQAAKLGMEAQNHAAELRLRAERKAGELLAELERGQTAGLKRGPLHQAGATESPYRTVLTENDIAPTTAHRWQKIATIPETVFEQEIEQTKAEKQELTTAAMLRVANGKPHIAHASGENEWYTPSQYIEAARTVMGSINVDPASTAAANEIVKADRFYSLDDNGLVADWYGNVWMNPPYAQPAVSMFSAKLVEQWECGNVQSAIVLINNATETVWFQSLVRCACAVCFPLARVRFWQPGGATGAPLQGQAVLYLGKDAQIFIQHFGVFGWCAMVTR